MWKARFPSAVAVAMSLVWMAACARPLPADSGRGDGAGAGGTGGVGGGAAGVDQPAGSGGSGGIGGSGGSAGVSGTAGTVGSTGGTAGTCADLPLTPLPNVSTCDRQIRVVPGTSGCSTSSSSNGLSLFGTAACLEASAGSTCNATIAQLVAEVDFGADILLEICDWTGGCNRPLDVGPATLCDDGAIVTARITVPCLQCDGMLPTCKWFRASNQAATATLKASVVQQPCH